MIRPRLLPGGLTTSDFENRNLFVVTEGQLNLTLLLPTGCPQL